MSKEQKYVLRGLLEDKKEALEQVVNSLKARISSISILIMPEMDLEDQNFSQAKILIDECVGLRTRYDALREEIKELEESI